MNEMTSVKAVEQSNGRILIIIGGKLTLDMLNWDQVREMGELFIAFADKKYIQ